MTSLTPRRRLILDAATMSVAVFVALYFPDGDDTSGAVIGSLTALPAAALGLAAARASRVLPLRSVSQRARYAGLALLFGAAAGVANLLVNYALTAMDPRTREAMLRKITMSSDWSMVVSAPVVEELIFRLLALSGIVWLLRRFPGRRERAFPVALVVSAILFAFIHVAYPIRAADALMLAHTSGVLVKSGAAGVLLGWVFWRWGLPNSIACHAAANGIHILLAPLLF